MAIYSIKDLENYTGIKAHTIRIWEKRYNIVEPKRTPTNIRHYNDDDLKRLLNVSILNRQGFKISNIVNFSDEMLNEKILSLTLSNSNVEGYIESLVIAMLNLDEPKFEKVFNTGIINLGFEDAVLKIMYPFFEKIGVLWQIGTINPVHEHFVSNLLRQKLNVAIDGIAESLNEKSKSFLLFLPEAEYHELGLIFYHYLLRKNGHKVIYLGETVPLSGLEEIARLKDIDYLLTSIVTAVPVEAIADFLDKLSKHFNNSKILLTGIQIKNFELPLPANSKYIGNVIEFKQLLAAI